jgi:hypothetical protein
MPAKDANDGLPLCKRELPPGNLGNDFVAEGVPGQRRRARERDEQKRSQASDHINPPALL